MEQLAKFNLKKELIFANETVFTIGDFVNVFVKTENFRDPYKMVKGKITDINELYLKLDSSYFYDKKEETVIIKNIQNIEKEVL